MSQAQKVLIEPLAPRNYIEPEVLVDEQNRIFARSWQYACHIEKLRHPGDYIVCEIAQESLILIRCNWV
jgi:phenylpropionate dioxygenase-like ring-hydroxylating dioxygenase large terminal subunit